MKLSEKIYRIRKARGYSQEQFGAMLGDTSAGGISRQSVSSWEKGENEPTLDNLREIAKVLNVSFNVLLDETIDLDDDDTMMSVLSGRPAAVRNDARSRFNYSIRPYGVKARHYVWLALFPVVLTAAIALTCFAFPDGKMNDLLFWFGFLHWMAVAVVISPFVMSLKAIITGNPGIGIASLDVNGITIHTSGKAQNTIFIPREKIDRLEPSGKQTKKHGNVDIFVKDREKPVTLLNVWKPAELLEIYGKLDSYIEDSDGIKIL